MSRDGRGLHRPSCRVRIQSNPVAPNEARLKTVAACLRDETGRLIEAVPAHPTISDKAQSAKIQTVLRDDPGITMLVNDAGIVSVAPLPGAEVERTEAITALNVTAVTRITYTALPGVVARRAGSIINRASVVCTARERLISSTAQPKLM